MLHRIFWIKYFLFILLFSDFSRAAPSHGGPIHYRWTAVSQGDVLAIESPKLDLLLRLKLIEQARRSIDIVVYDVRPDTTFTLPILKALRDAADRGVRVRLMVSWLPHVLFDRNQQVAHFLMEPPTHTPIMFTIMGGPRMEDRGWNLLDGTHEKTFIIDRTIALTSGRGFSEDTLYWLDMTFLLRGGLVAQNADASDRLWKEALATQPRFQPPYTWKSRELLPEGAHALIESVDTAVLDRAGVQAHLGLSGEEAAEHLRVLDWIDSSPQVTLATKAAPPKQGAGRGRVLHFNFLHQMNHLPYAPSRYSVAARTWILEDPVLDALILRIERAHRIRLTLLSTILHPRLKAALLQALVRPDTDVKIFTNLAPPSIGYRGHDPIEPWGPVWHVELPDLADLVGAGAKAFGFQRSATKPWIYLHRKLAVVDDTVFFGSHNFHLPSSLSNDELSFEIEDPELAQDWGHRFDASLQTNAQPLEKTSVIAEMESICSRIQQAFFSQFLGFF